MLYVWVHRPSGNHKWNKCLLKSGCYICTMLYFHCSGNINAMMRALSLIVWVTIIYKLICSNKN